MEMLLDSRKTYTKHKYNGKKLKENYIQHILKWQTLAHSMKKFFLIKCGGGGGGGCGRSKVLSLPNYANYGVKMTFLILLKVGCKIAGFLLLKLLIRVGSSENDPDLLFILAIRLVFHHLSPLIHLLCHYLCPPSL